MHKYIIQSILVIFSVSNALKPQRKTSITGLNPATHYIVKVEAYNIAGSSMEEFSFITLTKDGGKYTCSVFSNTQTNNSLFSDVPPPDLMKQGDDGGPLYTDIKIVLPLTIIVLILLSSGTSTVVCLRSSMYDNYNIELNLTYIHILTQIHFPKCSLNMLILNKIHI